MPDSLTGYDFYKKIGSPKLILAPMVDQSELAWRLLGRKYGAQLAYTPMFHAANFVRDQSYRKEAMEYSPKDRPLIYQFCSNDPIIFTEAAKLVQNHCDAIDLNLGCPQMIAKRGHYGSYLQDEWDLIAEMLKRCVKEVSVPVTAKIRAQSTVELTIEYAKMIESCGVSLLTIHGRTRDQKGVNTGLADWSIIKAVKEALSIPVIANGNILYYSDIIRCLEVTGADGVMSAEGHLHNPGIFTPEEPKLVWEMALEYLTLAKDHPCNISYSRGHVFKLLHHTLHCHPEIRELISHAKDVDDLISAVNQISKICGVSNCNADEGILAELPHRHWFCQPYIRPAFKAFKQIGDDDKSVDNNTIETNCDNDKSDQSENVIYQAVSMIKLKEHREEERRKKKEARQLCKENKAKKIKIEALPCVNCCCNMRGLKCEYNLCRTCCKKNPTNNIARCVGHSHMKLETTTHSNTDSSIPVSI